MCAIKIKRPGGPIPDLRGVGGGLDAVPSGSLDTQVKISRPTEDSAVIRRRRVCLTCNFRFTTFERVQLRELTVIKRNGRRRAVRSRQAVRSVQVALRKRPVEPERIDAVVSKIVRELKARARPKCPSETIGETGDGAICELRSRPTWPYVRFASVYRNFREAKDFRHRARPNCRATTSPTAANWPRPARK